jgi:hypothetical protein
MYISLDATRQLKKKVSIAPFKTVMHLTVDILSSLT